MEVETDSRYFSWEDLLDCKTSSLSGFVTSYTKLEKLIENYEYTTSSRFRTLKSSKHFGKKRDISLLKKWQFRFCDTQKNSEPFIDFDGIPFLIMGKKILECHQGPDRDGKTNEKKLQKCTENSDHTYKKRRRMVQTSKKKGCPAKVRIRHVVKFPGYQLAENKISKYCRNKVISELKQDLSNNMIPTDKIEHRFYIQFPAADGHLNHLKGEDSDFESDVILGIYHRSHHWMLVIVEVKKGIIYFYNPCGERKMEMRKTLSSWRKYEKDYREKFNVQTKASDWRITSTPHTNQKDSFNCGVFCLMFAEKHLTGDVDCLSTITSEDLKCMRRDVASKLMQGKVFLKGCCPKCAKNIEDDESIKCSTCRRSFHFKPFCIEEDLADIKEAEYFKCRLCKINFWNKEETQYNLRKHPLKISTRRKKRPEQG